MELQNLQLYYNYVSIKKQYNYFEVDRHSILFLDSKNESIAKWAVIFARSVKNVRLCTDSRCQPTSPLSVNNVLLQIFSDGYHLN